MRLTSLLTTCALAVLLVSCGGKELKLGPRTVKKVVDAMTTDEKVKLLVGSGMAAGIGDSAVMQEARSLLPGAAGTTYPIPRLGIPAIVLADGPAGLRINPTRDGDTINHYYCTAFPVATALAASWDQDMVESLGMAMGNEVLEYGADVLLAPAMNLHRNPLCGRNFEYYSEDPVLSGKMAAAFIRGVQSNGVGTAVKHFAANNQETNRQNNDARISQRALRELYLKGFEIAIKEGEPWTVMTSYNKINGTYTSESEDLLGRVLRYDWKFKGVVMTDWFGGKDPVAQIKAGNDLLMPGSSKQFEALMTACKDSVLTKEVLDVSVERMLRLIIQTPRFKGYRPSGKPDLESHAKVARKAASEGMVLLENKGVLPIPVEKRRVLTTLAVFGVSSYDFISGGTGSGDVNEAYTVSLVEGLKKAGYDLYSEPRKVYEAYLAKGKEDVGKKAFGMMPASRKPELIPDKRMLEAAAEMSDAGVLTIGRTSGEFRDRKLDNDFNLTAAEKQLIKSVTDAFHAVKKSVVVILNIGGPIEVASWKSMADAILIAWQPGQEAGNSVADVLKGAVSPSGRLPMTFPLVYTDVPSASNFPSNAPAVERNRSGKKMKNVDFTNYEEDIYVGYRYYTTFNKKVAYPFGYGLSYTEFRYGKPNVLMKKKNYLVKFSVENTGKVAGREVAQLYVCPPGKSGLERPMRELKGFVKTKELAPGESVMVTISVPVSDLAAYNPATSSMELEKGLYSFELGSSCLDVKSSILVDMEQKIWKTADGLAPAKGLKTLSAIKK